MSRPSVLTEGETIFGSAFVKPCVGAGFSPTLPNTAQRCHSKPVTNVTIVVRSNFLRCHCEEQSDVAIRFPRPQARNSQSLPCVKGGGVAKGRAGGIVVTPVLASLCEGGVKTFGFDGGRDTPRSGVIARPVRRLVVAIRILRPHPRRVFPTWEGHTQTESCRKG